MVVFNVTSIYEWRISVGMFDYQRIIAIMKQYEPLSHTELQFDPVASVKHYGNARSSIHVSPSWHVKCQQLWMDHDEEVQALPYS
jgi:hypothetical protein